MHLSISASDLARYQTPVWSMKTSHYLTEVLGGYDFLLDIKFDTFGESYRSVLHSILMCKKMKDFYFNKRKHFGMLFHDTALLNHGCSVTLNNRFTVIAIVHTVCDIYMKCKFYH